MAKQAVYSIAASEIPSQFKNAAANILWAKLQKYGITVTSNGEFFETLNGAAMKRNHIRCLLRKDYLSEGRTDYSPTQLNYFIDSILIGAVAATKAVCSRIQEMKDSGELPD